MRAEKLDMEVQMDNKDYKTIMVQPMLDVPHAAEFLSVKVPTIRKWVAQRTLTYYKIGGLIRFRYEDLTSFLEERKVSALTGSTEIHREVER
jgi:excisionase family DNA binding protein